MKTHLSSKLICNYNLGKCPKETQKGLIEWHFPMSPFPEKWDKMGGLPQGVKGADIWGIVKGIQLDKYLLFELAKLQGEIILLQTHKVEEMG